MLCSESIENSCNDIALISCNSSKSTSCMEKNVLITLETVFSTELMRKESNARIYLQYLPIHIQYILDTTHLDWFEFTLICSLESDRLLVGIVSYICSCIAQWFFSISTIHRWIIILQSCDASVFSCHWHNLPCLQQLVGNWHAVVNRILVQGLFTTFEQLNFCRILQTCLKQTHSIWSICLEHFALILLFDICPLSTATKKNLNTAWINKLHGKVRLSPSENQSRWNNWT